MPSSTLAARARLVGRYGQRDFALADLPAALVAAAPNRLTIDFEVEPGGAPAFGLECGFDDATICSGRAPDRARQLEEYLVRADVAGHLDYAAVDQPASVQASSGGFELAIPGDLALASGQWLAMPLPLLEVAAPLLAHAQAAGRSAIYRLELARRDPYVSVARSLVPALAALTTRGRQPAWQGCLEEAVALLSDSGWRARESLLPGADGESLDGLASLAAKCVRARWSFVDDGLIALAPASAEAADPSNRALAIQQARADGYLEEVFGRLLPSLPAGPYVPRASATTGEEGTYVFLSYSHADRLFAAQVIDRLQHAGVEVWYDAGIEPGMAWDDSLEQRLRGAGAVVACVSSSFEESRWCTRELKFADFLRKPIVPVAAGPWIWGQGLQLMFQSLQVCDFDRGRGATTILSALGAQAPSLFDATRRWT